MSSDLKNSKPQTDELLKNYIGDDHNRSTDSMESDPALSTPVKSSKKIATLRASVRPLLQSGDFVITGFDLPLTELGVKFSEVSEKNDREMKFFVGTLDQALNSDPEIRFGIREASLKQRLVKSNSVDFYGTGGLFPLANVPWQFIGSYDYPFPVYNRTYEEKLVPTRDIGMEGDLRISNFSLIGSLVNGQGEDIRNIDDNFTAIASIRHSTKKHWFSLSGGSGTTGVLSQDQERRFASFDMYYNGSHAIVEGHGTYRLIKGFDEGSHYIYSLGLVGKLTEIWWLGLRGGYLGSYQGRESQVNGLFSGRLRMLGFNWNAGIEGFWNSQFVYLSYRYIVSTQWDWETDIL